MRRKLKKREGAVLYRSKLNSLLIRSKRILNRSETAARRKCLVELFLPASCALDNPRNESIDKRFNGMQESLVQWSYTNIIVFHGFSHLCEVVKFLFCERMMTKRN